MAWIAILPNELHRSENWKKRMFKSGTSKSGVPAELEAIVRNEDNRFCADCGSKGPRWASVNLGYALIYI